MPFLITRTGTRTRVSTDAADPVANRLGRRLGHLTQRGNFRFGQRAPLTRTQIAKFQRANFRAHQPRHRMPEHPGNPADLTLATFVHRDRQMCVGRIAIDNMHFGGQRWAVIQHDAALPHRPLLIAQFAAHRYVVDFRVFIARMSQFLREIAVVGHQDEASAVRIQPPDRK